MRFVGEEKNDVKLRGQNQSDRETAVGHQNEEDDNAKVEFDADKKKRRLQLPSFNMKDNKDKMR